jgi:hypothetical protein
MLDRMPPEWERSMVVIRTPALPSTAQIESSLTGTSYSNVPIVDLDDLARLVVAERPEVVVLSVRGPVVRVLVRMIVAATSPRPVIVSGLPGISIPETLHALYFRSQVDLVVLHSKREIAAFTGLAHRLGITQQFGLATLPFLPSRRTVASTGDDIVFAAQAKVPKLRHERERVLDWLIATAVAHPDRRVILKLRGIAGEAQTHAEKYPYDRLLALREDLPSNLVVSTGAMGEHLESAAAVVTVSSTAAIEAIALGVPVLLIDDFGVSGGLINLVFDESGLFGSSQELIDGVFKTPNEHWLDDNYFHAPSDETWIREIENAVARRDAADLPLRPQYRGSLGGNLRRIWDRKQALGPYDRTVSGYLALAVGMPARGALRRYRRVVARARRSSADYVVAPAQPTRR